MEPTRQDMPKSEFPERISEASSLPIGDAQVPVQPGNIVAPEIINTKVLMARSIDLAHTDIEDKNTREADDDHQAVLVAGGASGVYRCVWSRRG
jgi:hypothetical protein